MEGFAEGAIWVEMGSIKPEEARAHAARFAERGMGYVDAPVSGGTKGAEGATLAIMAGGTWYIMSDLGGRMHQASGGDAPMHRAPAGGTGARQ